VIVPFDRPCTQEAFAEIVGVARQQITELVRGGVLREGASAHEWLLAYCARLQDEALNRNPTQIQERTRLEQLRADHLAMIVDDRMRQLVPRDLLELLIAQYGVRIQLVFDQLPERIRTQLKTTDPALEQLIRDDLERVRAVTTPLQTPTELVETYIERSVKP
jgi:transcriptional regulator with XRE-family HTH domain